MLRRFPPVPFLLRLFPPFLFLAVLDSPAAAFVLEGGITRASTPGAFVKLQPGTARAVGNDTFQDPNLYAFDEDQNILLDRDIRVDLAPGRPLGGLIAKGTVVASHYVFFDPAGVSWQEGFVEFDAPILGVATRIWTLQATDFLANTKMTYLNPGLRGLEVEDRVWIDPENPFRLNVDWLAWTPGDYIRVFTARSPGV
ncbi:MAG: hypothetical protein AAGC92_04085 [Pseudomonadota bacterium]